MTNATCLAILSREFAQKGATSSNSGELEAPHDKRKRAADRRAWNRSPRAENRLGLHRSGGRFYDSLQDSLGARHRDWHLVREEHPGADSDFRADDRPGRAHQRENRQTGHAAARLGRRRPLADDSYSGDAGSPARLPLSNVVPENVGG